MTFLRFEKAVVAGKEGRAFYLVKEGKDFLILHSAMPNIDSYLFNRNTPTFEKLALILGDIFVENVHTASGSSANSSA